MRWLKGSIKYDIMDMRSGISRIVSNLEEYLKHERDSQRQRLYNAEKVLAQLSKRLETPAEMAAFLTKVCNRAPIQRRYGPFLRSSIEVRDGRGCRSALGSTYWIKMPKWARTEYIVLHEAAHSLTRRKHGLLVAGHGREYASIYLDLIRFGLGVEAHDALKASFIEHRVKFRPKSGKAKPVFQRRVAFKAAAKTKPPAPRAKPSAAYAEFRRLAKLHGFTYKVVVDGHLRWIETNDFPVSGLPFNTMHYNWEETLRRVQMCLDDPTLLDEEGGYTE
jgi:hypothetical protein